MSRDITSSTTEHWEVQIADKGTESFHRSGSEHLELKYAEKDLAFWDKYGNSHALDWRLVHVITTTTRTTEVIK